MFVWLDMLFVFTFHNSQQKKMISLIKIIEKQLIHSYICFCWKLRNLDYG